MKLTKVQKTTRFIVHTIGSIMLIGNLSGILPAIIAGQIYQIFC